MPKSLTDRILELPDSELFTERPVTVKQEQDGACGHWPVLGFDMDELKRLARSHKRIIAAAQLVLPIIDGDPSAFAILAAAIEEGEKL